MSIRPFFDTARDIRRGQFLEDAADELQRVIAAVEETGKAAKLTIEIGIKPAGGKLQGAVILSDRIKAKLPELPAGDTILFVTTENNLVATDPRQRPLDLKQVADKNAPTENLKTA